MRSPEFDVYRTMRARAASQDVSRSTTGGLDLRQARPMCQWPPEHLSVSLMSMTLVNLHKNPLCLQERTLSKLFTRHSDQFEAIPADSKRAAVPLAT